MTRRFSASITPEVTSYAYDAAGAMDYQLGANGITHDYRYNALGRLIGLDHFTDTNGNRKHDTGEALTARFEYQYDAVGNRTQANEKLLDDPLFRKLLKQTLEQFYRYPKHARIDDDAAAWVARIDLAAGDSTGFESGHCSKYFTKRRKQGKNKGDPDEPVAYRSFPKLGIVAGCDAHMILGAVRGLGPRPDADQVLPLMEGMTGDVLPDTTLWDAGFDSENSHELLREYLGIESIIPATIGRPTDKLPAGKWRLLMATDFDPEDVYGQRWQAEAVMRMIKARQGESLTARSDDARHAELGLMVLTHNLMAV